MIDWLDTILRRIGNISAINVFSFLYQLFHQETGYYRHNHKN